MDESDRLQMHFDDNSLLPQLFGERDRHLDRIERELGVSLVSRGNRLAIAGPQDSADAARNTLTSLYQRLKRGLEVDNAAVEAALKRASLQTHEQWGEAEEIRTRKRRISPRSANQAADL